MFRGLLVGFLVLGCGSFQINHLRAEAPNQTVFGTIQTGLASEFQLSLGGRFGPGPAFQQRLTLGVANVFERGDSISVSGSSSLDTKRFVSDREFGLWYFTPVRSYRGTRFRAGITGQRWIYPSVHCGQRDWVLGGQAQLQRKLGEIPLTITADVRRNVVSRLPTGNLFVFQASTQHRLLGNDRRRLVLRHGPSYAYADGFYAKFGHRQVRYGGSLAWEQGSHTLEVSGRKQFGLQPGIPDNPYYGLAWTVGFGRN